MLSYCSRVVVRMRTETNVSFLKHYFKYSLELNPIFAGFTKRLIYLFRMFLKQIQSFNRKNIKN